MCLLMVARGDCQDFLPAIGDTLYNVKTRIPDLPGDFLQSFDFSQINCDYCNFPCQRRITVSKSRIPGANVSLIYNTGRSEHYSSENGKLLWNAFEDEDPFFARKRTFVQFFNPLTLLENPVTSTTQISERNEILFAYGVKQLPEDIRSVLTEKDISKMEVRCGVYWRANYRSRTSFQFYADRSTGFAVQYELTILPEGVRFTDIQGGEVGYTLEAQLYQKYLTNKVHRFVSFFSPGKSFEVARVDLDKVPKISLFTTRAFQSISKCRNTRNAIYLYPNPTFEKIYLQFEDTDPGNYVFQVTNIIGKKLWEKTIQIRDPNSTVNFNLSGLPKGLYLYSVINEQGERIQSKRLVIIEP